MLFLVTIYGVMAYKLKQILSASKLNTVYIFKKILS